MNQVQRLRVIGALTALLMALGLIFSASARADTCDTYDFASRTFSGTGENLRVSWVTQDVHSLLWVQTGAYVGQDEYEETISHEVPEGAISATVCEDGSVRFELGADPMPTPVVVDIPAPVLGDTPTVDGTADPVLSDAIPWAPMEARI